MSFITKLTRLSKYSENCSPVQFIPELAKEIGIPRAMILRQLQYWLYKPAPNYSKVIPKCRDNSGALVANHRWVKDSYTTLAKRIKCLGFSTIKRNLTWLHKYEFIYVANRKTDKTSYGINWYSINYDEVNDLFMKSKYTPNTVTENTHMGIKHDSDSVALRDVRRQNRKLMGALKKSRANMKKLRQSYNGVLQARGGVKSNHPWFTNNKGVGSQITKGGVKTTKTRMLRANHPTNESENYYESLHETAEERPDPQFKDKVPSNQVPSDPSYLKVERAYKDTFGKALTNRAYKLVKQWDADLIIIAIHVTASHLTATEDYRILGYVRKVLEDYTRKGITTAKQWHDAHQHRDNHDAKAGGTPSDMKGLSFEQQMAQVVSSVRTGINVFPPVNEQDKNNAKFVVSACNILAKQRHIDRSNFDFWKLSKNDCELAKHIVKSENKEKDV